MSLQVPEGVDTIFNSGYGVASAYERDPIELPERVIVFDDKNGGFATARRKQHEAIIKGFFPSRKLRRNTAELINRSAFEIFANETRKQRVERFAAELELRRCG